VKLWPSNGQLHFFTPDKILTSTGDEIYSIPYYKKLAASFIETQTSKLTTRREKSADKNMYHDLRIIMYAAGII
jgi:hypothetical protein